MPIGQSRRNGTLPAVHYTPSPLNPSPHHPPRGRIRRIGIGGMNVDFACASGHGVVDTGSDGGGNALLIILGGGILFLVFYMARKRWRGRKAGLDAGDTSQDIRERRRISNGPESDIAPPPSPWHPFVDQICTLFALDLGSGRSARWRERHRSPQRQCF
jgi:hypothetical protein